MKYKEGQKVKVREDLETGKIYQGYYFVKSMKKYKGKMVTINCVEEDFYNIKEDEGEWNWSEKMFEGLASFKKSDLKNGDICTLRNGDTGTYKNGLTNIGLREEQINNDLTNNGLLGKTYDIVKVERPIGYETLFERKEVKEMTLQEVCEKLGYEVKIIKED